MEAPPELDPTSRLLGRSNADCGLRWDRAIAARRAAHTSQERKSVGVSSSFGENAAICLQGGRRPDCKSHLALTLIAAANSDSCVASSRQCLNRCDVHFATALTGRAFCTTGL